MALVGIVCACWRNSNYFYHVRINHEQVPPLAGVFAKLFLLQGISYAYDSEQHPESAAKGTERLDQAFVLIQCLRSAAPEESVEKVLQAMGSFGDGTGTAYAAAGPIVTRADAIAALRKSKGDLDAAATALSDSVSDRQQRQRDRDIQRRHGLCDNEADPVNLAMIKVLQPMLFRDGATSSNLANESLTVGLLRLANNDLARALEVYKEQNYEIAKVDALVDALDQRLYGRGLLDRAALTRKKRRRLHRQDDEVTVDEIALATLVSMGVENRRARRALQKNGNDVEKSLLWLSQTDRQVSAAPNETSRHDNHEETGTDGDDGDEVMQKGGAEGIEPAETVQPDEVNNPLLPEWNAEEPGVGDPPFDPERDARELLQRELGGILDERDLEKEYLGNSLDEEWRLLQKYRPSN